MKVVILCGGKGTRLREHTESIPKPLIDVGGRPILWHIMRIYASFGFADFVLCLGYRGDALKQYFIDNPAVPWNITFVDTGDDTNTGGRVKRVAALLQDEPSFMLTYGDGVADIDIRELVRFHESHGAIGTMTVVNPLSQFGIVDLDDDGHVSKFKEKPRLEHWINGGFFVFRNEFLSYVEDNSILEREPLERLAERRQLMAFRHERYWQCMDTYKDTVQLNELWATGGAPWKVW